MVKTALVTGGARRIGRAIVDDLCKHGFAVAIHCNRSRNDADALSESLRAGGSRVAVIQADLSNRDALEGVVDAAIDEIGPLGLLVNNASVFEPDLASDFDWDVWDKHFDLHVKAPVMLARKFAENIDVRSTGLVVNIIDQRVLKPTPLYFSYALSKSALWTATQTMAQSFAPRVRVNAIGPGPTFANSRQTRDDFEAQARSVLLGHGPAPDEFGAAIRYLWEARSVTGQMIAIDGGQHLAWQTPDATEAE